MKRFVRNVARRKNEMPVPITDPLLTFGLGIILGVTMGILIGLTLNNIIEGEKDEISEEETNDAQNKSKGK